MSLFDQITPIGSLIIAFATVVFTTLMLARQARQMEHERNALALIEAIDRLSSTHVVAVFDHLKGIAERYPSDKDLAEKFFGSEDEHALFVVGQYIETVACLARRRVLDPSLLVDAIGFLIRLRWATIEKFVAHWRRYNENEYLFENFEWLARYSDWWKDIPRPRDPNYDPNQFARK